jgi:hypothetical protein
MRTIDTHKANPLNDKLNIQALDEPGAGGASHVYAISGMQMHRNVAALACPDPEDDNAATIIFQCGPIAEQGVNGITQEVLLAIVIDRLECFQEGPYPCNENQMALLHAKKALIWLYERTLKRMERGVEGTSEK